MGRIDTKSPVSAAVRDKEEAYGKKYLEVYKRNLDGNTSSYLHGALESYATERPMVMIDWLSRYDASFKPEGGAASGRAMISQDSGLRALFDKAGKGEFADEEGNFDKKKLDAAFLDWRFEKRKPVKAEDKIMNGFLQQDNKYKMGK